MFSRHFVWNCSTHKITFERFQRHWAALCVFYLFVCLCNVFISFTHTPCTNQWLSFRFSLNSVCVCVCRCMQNCNVNEYKTTSDQRRTERRKINKEKYANKKNQRTFINSLCGAVMVNDMCSAHFSVFSATNFLPSCLYGCMHLISSVSRRTFIPLSVSQLGRVHYKRGFWVISMQKCRHTDRFIEFMVYEFVFVFFFFVHHISLGDKWPHPMWTILASYQHIFARARALILTWL